MSSRTLDVLGTALAGVVTGALTAVISVLQHRTEWAVLGVDVPVGLILGGALNLALCLYLLWSAKNRIGVVLHLVSWLFVFLVLAQTGNNGGVLIPAALAGQIQYQAVAVQVIGVGVPVLVLVVDWFRRMRRLLTTRRPAAATKK